MKIGLCKGRHEIKGVSEYIFEEEINPLDISCLNETVETRLAGVASLELYVTGLSVALVAVINYCCANLVPLTLWHYNRDNGDYYPQVVVTDYYKPLLQEGGYIK